MAQERLQVGSGVNQPGLDVVATPVNTFDPNAGNAAASKLEQLAQGLASISPAVAQFAQQAQIRKNTGDEKAGIAFAQKLVQKGQRYGDAVRDGSIPGGASPFYMMGLHESLGRNVGDRFQAAWEIQKSQDANLATSTIQDDFVQAKALYYKQWTAENILPAEDNTSFNEGFSGRYQAYNEQETQRDAATIIGRIADQSDDALFTEQHTHFGLNASASPENVAADATDMLNDAVARGYTHQRANQITYKAAMGAAIDAPNAADGLRILAAADLLQGGSGGTLSNTQWGSELRRQALATVSGKMMKQNAATQATADAAQAAKTSDIQTQALRAQLAHQPDMSGYVKALLDNGDPKAASDLQHSASEVATASDEVESRRLLAGAYQGTTSRSQVSTALAGGFLSIPDATRIEAAITAKESWDKDPTHSPQKTPGYEDAHYAISTHFRGENFRGFDTSEMAEHISHAMTNLNIRLQSDMASGAFTPQNAYQWYDRNVKQLIAREDATTAGNRPKYTQPEYLDGTTVAPTGAAPKTTAVSPMRPPANITAATSAVDQVDRDAYVRTGKLSATDLSIITARYGAHPTQQQITAFITSNLR